MEVDDVLGPEAALAAAATAVFFSPPVRLLVRRSAVRGLAGLLAVADMLRVATRVAGYGGEMLPDRAVSGLQDITDRSQETDGPDAGSTAGR